MEDTHPVSHLTQQACQGASSSKKKRVQQPLRDITNHTDHVHNTSPGNT